MNTPFSLDDDERQSEIDALLAQSGLQPTPPASAPASNPGADQADHGGDIMSSLGLMQSRGQASQNAPEPRAAPPPVGARLPDESPSQQPTAPAAMPSQRAITPMQPQAQVRQRITVPEPPMAKERGDQGTQAMIALALDALLNKGKNAGALIGIGAMGDGRDTAYENWQRRAKADEMQSQIDAREPKPAAPLSPTQVAAKNRDEREARLWSADSPESKAMAAAVIKAGGDPDLVAGRSYREMSDDPTIRATVQRSTEEGRNKNANAEHDRRQQDEYGLWLKKHGIEQGSAESLELFRREQAKQADIEKQTREDTRSSEQADMGFAGFKTVDPDRLRLKLRDPKNREEMQKATDKWRAVLDSLKQMEDLRKQYGKEWNSDHSAEFDVYRTAAIGELSQDVGQTGTVNAGEFPRYKAMLGQMEPSALDLLPGDRQLAKIRGVRRAFERLSKQKLADMGLEPDLGDEEQAAAPAKPSGRAPGKPKPSEGDESAAVYTVTLPSGKTLERALTPDEVTRLQAKGVKVQP